MKIQLVAIGKGVPVWVEQGYQTYAKRLSHSHCNLELIELPSPKRSKTTSVAQLMTKEAKSISDTVPDNAHVVALSIDGRGYSTAALSQRFTQWQLSGKPIYLIIGGPDGLAPSCLDRADEAWSLSPLTLPHPLVRIVVAEQLYRAWSMLQNHPYHRA